MEFLLLLAAVAGLFWVGLVVFRGGLIGTALLVLLAGTCFGHPFFNVAAGPLPITSDRLLLVVLLVQYIIYRRWGWADPKPLVAADYLLGLFLCVLVISTFTHDYQARKALALTQLLFFYMLPAALYWVMRQTRWSARSAGWLFASLAVFGAYLCLTAVAEKRGAWSFVFPPYIASTEFREFYGRGRGPLLNPAANGILQTLGLCAAMMAWPRWQGRGKLLVLALLPLFALGLYSTMTRSAWIGAGLALLVVAALTTPRSWRAPVIGTALLAVALFGVVGLEHFTAFKRDKELSAEETAESARLRPILAMVAWHMFLDRPLLGCGLGQYLPESRPYLSDRTGDLPLEKARPYIQHNVLLSQLTEIGLVGMGLFVAVLATWARTAWRVWRSRGAPLWARQLGLLYMTLLAAYLANGMFQDVSVIPMMNMFLFFLGGVMVSLTRWIGPAPREGRLRVWSPDMAEEELAAAW